jgi:putative membrane protein
MKMLTDILVGFIALEHAGFLVLEMFLWTHRIGRKIFQQTPEAAESSRLLVANQGLYNGFLAAGLAWGLISGDWSIKFFFVACVFIAGIYGGVTVKRSILIVQASPALIALLLLFAAR